jgi:hypothetical protein
LKKVRRLQLFPQIGIIKSHYEVNEYDLGKKGMFEGTTKENLKKLLQLLHIKMTSWII